MAFAHSPKTSTEDLVLIYDTGNGKSFAGEPTVNLVTNDNTRTFDNGSDGNWTYQTVAGSGSISIDNPKSGTHSAKLTRSGAGGEVNYYWNAGPGLSLTPGVTYTFSMDVWCNQPNMAKLFSYLAGTNSSSTYHPGDSKWYRLSMQFSPAASTAAAQLRFGVMSNGNYPATAYFDNVQIEQKSHVTPFVTGTRSADSGSLSDLAGNVELDVTNAGFDSSANLAFDGSSDHITGVLPISGGGEPHTIEMVLSPDQNQSSGFGSRKDPFSIGNTSTHQYSALDINTSYMNWYFYGKDTTFTNNPTLVAGQYYHFVLSYAGGFSNNTNKRVWINGIEQTLSAGVNEVPLLPDNPQFSVGRDRGRNTAYFPGEIPLFKVYKKGLTEEEALANFNAIRARFNI